MKLFIANTNGSLSSLLDKWQETELLAGSVHEADTVLVAEAVSLIPTGKTVINSCPAVIKLLTDEESTRQAMEILGIVPAVGVSSVFYLFNGTTASGYAEVSHSGRFMSGEAGIDIGFAQGVMLLPECNILEAVPMISKINKFLSKINYRGEVLLRIGEDFTVCGVTFGHSPALFAMFCELGKQTVEQNIQFMAGEEVSCDLHDAVVSCVTVSQQPYPFLMRVEKPLRLRAPQSAEKHIWRNDIYGNEVCFITTHGRTVQEAKRRMYRTVHNMQTFCPFLQYRNDCGYGIKFVVSQEKFQRLVIPAPYPEKTPEVSQPQAEPATDTSEVAPASPQE